eukprot:6746725-Prymnesium_polylepis.1
MPASSWPITILMSLEVTMMPRAARGASCRRRGLQTAVSFGAGGFKKAGRRWPEWLRHGARGGAACGRFNQRSGGTSAANIGT